MAGTLKTIEITVACSYGNVGRRFTPNASVAEWLLARGWGKVVEDEKADKPKRGKVLPSLTRAVSRELI